MFFTTVPFENATGDFAYGLRNINISETSAGIAPTIYQRLMDTAALTYEEYRIRRVTVHGQPGNGFTNDDRVKTSVFARVDVNSQPTTATLDNLNSVICSESSVNRTFTERNNVKLADFRPLCYSIGGTGSSSRPMLPSQLQWYNIDERSSHLWRGATVCPVIPESSISPGTKALTIWAEIEIEFRTRRPELAFTGGLYEDQFPNPEEMDEGSTSTQDRRNNRELDQTPHKISNEAPIRSASHNGPRIVLNQMRVGGDSNLL